MTDVKRPPSPERDRIPTYEESVAQRPRPIQSLSHPETSTVFSQISASRTARIDALIEDALLPRLHAQVEAGLSRTTTVLLPADSTAAMPSVQPLDVLNSNLTDSAVEPITSADTMVQDLPPTDINVTLLQLRGSTQNSAFWSQPGASTALAGALRARLRAEGHRIAGDPEHSPLMPAITSPPPEPERKRGFWRRVADSASDKSANGVDILHRPVTTEQRLGTGETKVDVEVRDVAMRSCNDLGLYESKSGPAVVVRIEIGGSDWAAAGGAGATGKN